MKAQGTPWLLLVLALCLPSCGWHAGLLAPGGARSIGVEIFKTDHKLLERNLEPIVSDAITRAVLDMVETRLLAPQNADVVLRGEILGYNRRNGSRNKDNELIETGIYVLLRASLVDRRSGAVLVPAIVRHGWSGYALAGQAPENESQARQRVIDYIARTLVLDLFTARIPVAEATPAQLD